MKNWKKSLMALFLGLIIFASTYAIAGTSTGGATTKYTVENTVIVLPTTKIVNNTPLHINEDAIAGSKLGAWLMYNSVNVQTLNKSITVTADAEYHSAIIRDNNQMFYLNNQVMPDVGIPLAQTPDSDHITIFVNFSRVDYNTTKNFYNFSDGAIGIVFTTNSSPIKLWDTTEPVIIKMNDNNSELYVYTKNKNDDYHSIGDVVTVDGLKIKIMDISTDSDRVLVHIMPPEGTGSSGFDDIFSLNSVNIYYINKDGQFVESTNQSVDDLLKEGVSKVYMIKVTDIFSGLNSNMARIQAEYYNKIEEYKDGQVYMGNWVWHIINESTFELKLHVDPEHNFPVVKLSMSNPVLKFPVEDLQLKAYFKLNNQSQVVDHYLRFVKPISTEKTVNYTTQTVYYPQPKGIILTDVQFMSIKPATKNVIIIGGWVSNKAWDWLTQTLGQDTINQWKQEVMTNGYIVKVVHQGDRNIVVLAGKDYTGTAQAVDYFINNILLH